MEDWTIEGPRHISRKSVISANHYESLNQLKLDIEKQKKYFQAKQKRTLEKLL